jgi:sodium/proline symporter
MKYNKDNYKKVVDEFTPKNKMLKNCIMVFVWKLILKPMGGLFGVYELLPAFIVSCVFIYGVSMMTREPSEEIQNEFETVRKMS